MENIERKFLDERGYEISNEELFEEYSILKANGQTESKSFSDYIFNCTEKNGTLTPV